MKHSWPRSLAFFAALLLAPTIISSCATTAEDYTDMRGRVSEIFSEPNVRALAEAAEHGNERAIDRLLKQGVDINAVGKFKVTPLWWAIRTRNKIGFSHLLAHGAQPNPPVETITVLQMAAGYEDSAFLEAVLPYKPDLDHIGGRKNSAVLDAAITYRRTHNLELLIKAGADLNLDDLGGTPMEHAAGGGASYDYVYTMLLAGADPTLVHPPLSGSRGKNRLATTIHSRIIDPNSEAYEWRERVIRFLKTKGIEAEKPPEESPRTKPLPPDLQSPQ